jgi:NAD(P)-dependent dehydrogenase (short-subunit alcohol dehydrogenase family)
LRADDLTESAFLSAPVSVTRLIRHLKGKRDDNDFTPKQNCACDRRIKRNRTSDGAGASQGRRTRSGHYGHSAQEAASVVAAIEVENGRANAVSADLGTPDGAALLAKQVRSIVGDRLDVLVLNAGISKSARIADYTVEDFDNLFATNVRGPFFLVQQLMPVLGEGSNIIVISSASARTVAGKPDVLPSAARNRNMRSGRMKSRMRQSPA